MLTLKRSLFLVFISGILSVSTLTAQQLERISITGRSDGNGYVLRYHLTEMVDSYNLVQPKVHLIQMKLSSPELIAENVQMPEFDPEVLSVELIQLYDGVGVEITSAEDLFITAETYPDQNMRDLLVNLEFSDQATLESIISGYVAYNWPGSDESPSEAESVEDESVAEADSEDEPQTDEEELQSVVERGPISAKIGISGGIGIANKIGGDFTADSRKDFLMGISAEITLPYVLSNNIKTGLETGIFYTQKGFLNPSVDRFNGETVLLDYVEVPILIRLQYNLTEVIKPKITGGIYTAFRANAEGVQNDERNDLNEFTNPFNVGLAGGIGSDFLVQNTSISLQLRIGLGLTPIFKSDFSGRENMAYISGLLGFHF